MNIKISGGGEEGGVVVGNTFDKYSSRNPVVRGMMNGFGASLADLVARVSPLSIHEIGCGEGYWVLRWNREGLAASGCDFSEKVIGLARENAVACGLSPALFETQCIYDLDPERHRADLIVCCEVLEHLERPAVALQALRKIVGQHLIVSVPDEPLWRMLNLARFKYVKRWGNTPGHVQHWSKNGFIRLVSQHFEVLEVRCPFPWTMLLCR